MLERIVGFQSRLRSNGFAAAVLMHPRDVYYFAGTGQPCNLLIPAKGEPILLARRALDWVKTDSDIATIIKGSGGKDLRLALQSAGVFKNGVKLGLSLDIVPTVICRKLEQSLPECTIEDVSPLLLEQRMRKDEKEIAAIRSAAELFQRAHEVMMQELRPGVTELEVASKVYAALRRGEHEGIPRFRRWDATLHPDGLVISGSNTWRISGHAMTVTGVGLSPSVPWGPSTKPLASGETVVIDVGINYHGYHADIARTYIVGKATAEQKRVFDVIKQVYSAIFAQVKPGVTGQALFKTAWEILVSHGLEGYFQGYGEMKGNYVGHGIGLEMDEPPVLDANCTTVLAENMTIALEPKVIIPEWGAIALEDTAVVTATGCEIFCPVTRELFEVT